MVVDPFTAVGTAASVLQITTEAWKLGKKLHRLYKDTHHVDESVNQLSHEVSSLGDTANYVHEQLEDVLNATKPDSPSEAAYDKNGQLWKCVLGEVNQCRQTLAGLRRIVDDVLEEGTELGHASPSPDETE